MTYGIRGKDKFLVEFETDICHIRRAGHPPVDEIDADDEDDGIGQGVDNIVGLAGFDGIDVIFVYEITNHP